MKNVQKPINLSLGNYKIKKFSQQTYNHQVKNKIKVNKNNSVKQKQNSQIVKGDFQ